MSSVEKDYDEKRNFIRMFVDATVTITDSETGKVYNGESRNLSGDGVLFVTDHEFALEQILTVDIRSEQSKLAPLTAELQVKRVLPQADKRFEIAGTINRVK